MSDLETTSYIWATAIEEWIAQGRSDEQTHAVRNFFSGKGAKAMQATSDLIAQEANKAQIQLVSELEEELPKPQIQLMGKLCDTCGDYMDYCNCARVQSSLLDQLTSWLEHKKQELERGKQP